MINELKFATKLTLLFSCIYIASAALVTFYMYNLIITVIEQQIRTRLEDHAFHTMDKIDRMLFERYVDAQVIHKDPVIMSKNSTPTQIKERLVQYTENIKSYVSMSFFDLNRIRIADTSSINVGKQQPALTFWNRISQGSDLIVDIGTSKSLNMTLLIFAIAVRDDHGSMIGVVVSRISLEKIFEIVRQTFGILHEGESELKVDLIDKAGKVIYSSYTEPNLWNKLSPDMVYIRDLLSAGHMKGSGRHDHPGIGDEIHVFAQEQGYRDFAGNGWTLLLHFPKKVAFAPAIQLRNQMMVILLSVGVPTLIGLYLLAHKISQPITRLSDASIAIGKGQLDLEVPVTSQDELGKLASSFNQMAADLRRYRDQLLDYSRELEVKVAERTAQLKGVNEKLQDELAEREKVEEQLHQSEARYRALVERMPAVTYTVAHDGTGSVVYVSPQIEALLGFTVEQWLHDRGLWLKQLHPDDRERVLAVTNRSRSGLEGVGYHIEYRLLSRDGREVWVSDEAVVGRDDTGQVPYLQGLLIDITERRNADEKLLLYQEQLRSMGSQLALVEERERRRIATDLHDSISQKLALCKIRLEGVLEAAAGAASLEPLEQVYQLIERAIEDARSLIYRISSPILYELGFEAALEWLLEDFQGRHGILCDLASDAQPKPLDEDIGGILFQAVSELLVNVVKHARAQRVAVSLLRDGDQIRVQVEDSGVGFDARAIGPRRREAGGFGLFSIRERLTSVGGHFKIESEPGRGTHITLVAPLRYEQADDKEQGI